MHLHFESIKKGTILSEEVSGKPVSARDELACFLLICWEIEMEEPNHVHSVFHELKHCM